MNTNIKRIEPVVSRNVSEEDYFWQSFKSVAPGVAIPKNGSGYEKGGEFNITAGMTVIRGTVRGTAGKLVEVWKRADTDDAAYLQEAGFVRNRQLDAPEVKLR